MKKSILRLFVVVIIFSLAMISCGKNDEPGSKLSSEYDTGYSGNITVDKNGNYHAVYMRSIKNNYPDIQEKLMYVKKEGDNWQITELLNTSSTVRTPMILNDSNNHLHVVFKEGKAIKYATNQSGSWVFENTGYNSDTSVIFKINSAGKINIITSYENDLNFITNESGSWIKNKITDYSFTDKCGMVIDKNNKIHIAYEGYSISDTNYRLYYATNRTGSWVLSKIHDNEPNYNGIIMEVDSNDLLHILWVDDNDSFRLKYTTGLKIDGSGSWITEVVSTVSLNIVGQPYNLDLKLDSTNKPHIITTSHPKFIHIYKNGASWEEETVDTTSTSGIQYISFVINSNDDMKSIYQEYISKNSNLRFGFKSLVGSWQTDYIEK